jgi:hypothetical protein
MSEIFMSAPASTPSMLRQSSRDCSSMSAPIRPSVSTPVCPAPKTSRIGDSISIPWE